MRPISGAIQLTLAARIALLKGFSKQLSRTLVKLTVSTDLAQDPNFKDPYWKNMGRVRQDMVSRDMVENEWQTGMAFHTKVMQRQSLRLTPLLNRLLREYLSN
jgi:hypothetical protein